MTRRIKIQGESPQDEPQIPPQEGATPVSEETVEQLRQEIESLRSQLEEKEAQRSAKEQEAVDNYNRFLRVMADLENFRRRSRQEMEEIRQFCNQEFVLAILPILDDFERALQAAEATQSFEALNDGVQLILRKFQDTLEKIGVTPIEALGKPFDPMMHEAILQVASPDHPNNAVIEELRKGYTLNDRVIRPTMVKVSKSD